MPDEFPVFTRASLYLPGTVALPSPFPTFGNLWLPSAKQLPGSEKETEMVAIGASIPPTTTIVRYVQAKFISAIFYLEKASSAEPSGSIDWSQGQWLFSPTYDQLRDLLGKMRRVIVYVPESAPVMTQTVCGQTAAESAENIGTLYRRCDCF
jgi:hypothetical protein